MKRLFIYLCLLVFTFGCYTHNRISDGDAMMGQQNYERAAREYAAALRRSPNNSKAFSGLQNASNQFLREQLKKFDEQFSKMQYVEAAETLKGLQAFINTYSGRGINATIPDNYLNRHQAVTNAEAEFYYLHGQRELAQGNFNEAISYFKETLGKASNYKNARELLQQAERGAQFINAEEFYQSGVRNFQAGNFRQAYRNFENSLKHVSGYKNAAEFKSHALERGKVRVGIFEFSNNTQAHGAQGPLYSFLVNNIVNSKSPFIDVVDRQNLDRLLFENDFSHSYSVNPSSAVRAGKMLGLNYVVTGKIASVFIEGGQILDTRVNAFELYYEPIDGKPFPRGRPVQFTLYEGSTNITIEAHYEIISIETGQVIKSNIVESHGSDAVKFARYPRPENLILTDPGNLQPGATGIEMMISAFMNNLTRVNQELFSERSTLKTVSEMQNDIIRSIGKQMAEEIIREFD